MKNKVALICFLCMIGLLSFGGLSAFAEGDDDAEGEYMDSDIEREVQIQETLVRTTGVKAFFRSGLWFKEIFGFTRANMDNNLTVYFTDSSKNITINDYNIVSRMKIGMNHWNSFSPSPNFREINDYDDADITVHTVYDPLNFAGKVKAHSKDGKWYDQEAKPTNKTENNLAYANKEWKKAKLWINKTYFADWNAELKYDRNHERYYDYQQVQKVISHELGHALSYKHQPVGTVSIMVKGLITSRDYSTFFNTPQLYDKTNWASRFN